MIVDRIVAKISIAAPITEDAFREIIPAGSRISVEKAGSMAAMAGMGMMPAAIESMLNRYQHSDRGVGESIERDGHQCADSNGTL